MYLFYGFWFHHHLDQRYASGALKFSLCSLQKCSFNFNSFWSCFRQPGRIFIPAIPMLLRIRELERESFSPERWQIFPIITQQSSLLYPLCFMISAIRGQICIFNSNHTVIETWAPPRSRGQKLRQRNSTEISQIRGLLAISQTWTTFHLSMHRISPKTPWYFHCVITNLLTRHESPHIHKAVREGIRNLG